MGSARILPWCLAPNPPGRSLVPGTKSPGTKSPRRELVHPKHQRSRSRSNGYGPFAGTFPAHGPFGSLVLWVKSGARWAAPGSFLGAWHQIPLRRKVESGSREGAKGAKDPTSSPRHCRPQGRSVRTREAIRGGCRHAPFASFAPSREPKSSASPRRRTPPHCHRNGANPGCIVGNFLS